MQGSFSLYKVTEFKRDEYYPRSRVHAEERKIPSCRSTLQVRVKERHYCFLWLRSLSINSMKVNYIGKTNLSSTNYSS